MVVLDQYTRRIVGFAVCQGSPAGPTVCRMLFHIICGSAPPTYLSSDHDPLFEYHRWKANLRILGVKEVKTVPYVPLSHPFVERLVEGMLFPGDLIWDDDPPPLAGAKLR